MSRGLHGCLLVMLCWLAAGTTHAAEAPDTLPGAGVPRIYCVQGLEHILPGDYYGCRALYHLQRGHYRQAMAMLEESAYWANKEAQHQLGLAFINGDIPDVPADPARGIAWLAVARERHQPDYERDYALAVARATPAERARAGTLYLALRKRYGDAVAGKRAVDRFNREIVELDEAASGGGIAWISGYGPFPVRAYTLSRQLHAEAESAFGGLQGSVIVGPTQRVEGRLDTGTLPARGSGAAAPAAAAKRGGH